MQKIDGNLQNGEIGISKRVAGYQLRRQQEVNTGKLVDNLGSSVTIRHHIPQLTNLNLLPLFRFQKAYTIDVHTYSLR